MPRPANRSTSVRKVPKRTPKRGSTIHFIRRVKGNRHSCALCGRLLQSVSSARGLPGSARAPNRKFGGNLCTACASRVLVVSSRVREGSLKEGEIDITLAPYVRSLLSSKS